MTVLAVTVCTGGSVGKKESPIIGIIGTSYQKEDAAIIKAVYYLNTGQKAKLDSIYKQENEELRFKIERRNRLNKIKYRIDKSFGDLFKALAESESSNNPNIYNKYGYIGLYQFGKSALSATGYGHVTFEKFKNDQSIFTKEEQYDAMIKLTKLNKRVLNRYIREYSGKVVNGVLITEAGLLAGAHIGGAGGVIKFLKSNGEINPSDANGTTIKHYIERFNECNVNIG